MLNGWISLLVTWFRCDRITSRPTEGRLLRLKQGDQLLIEGRLFDVRKRIVGMIQSSHLVQYELVEDGKWFDLRVHSERQTGTMSSREDARDSIIVFAESIVVRRRQRHNQSRKPSMS